MPGVRTPPSSAARTTETTRPTRGAEPEAKPPLTVARPAAHPEDVLEGVAHDAAKALLQAAQALKDVKGTGQETSGRGDPRISERRRYVSALLADDEHRFVSAAALEQLGGNLAADLSWVSASERKDYTLGEKDQFSWSKDGWITGTKMQKHFDERTAEAKVRAQGVIESKAKYFSADDASVLGLHFIPDAGLRQRSMVDTLLQFRAAASTGPQTVKLEDKKRIDAVGPAVVAEQRVLLAGAKLGPSDEEMAEWALLRELVASHPNSSVNSIFEARNSVGSLAKDGRPDASDVVLKWVKEDVPPGAHSSAYTAIHHNFSSATPRDISRFISEFIFTFGPRDERPELFAVCVEALQLARSGATDAARTLLDQVVSTATEKETLAPLFAAFDAAAPEAKADVLLAFLIEGAQTDPTQWPNQYTLPVGDGELRAAVQKEFKAALAAASAGRAEEARNKISGLVRAPEVAERLEAWAKELGAAAPETRAAKAEALFAEPLPTGLAPAEERILRDALRVAKDALARHRTPEDTQEQARRMVELGEALAGLELDLTADSGISVGQKLKELSETLAARPHFGGQARTSLDALSRALLEGAYGTAEALAGLAPKLEAFAASAASLPDAELRPALQALLAAPEGQALPYALRSALTPAGTDAALREKLGELTPAVGLIAGVAAELAGMPRADWKTFLAARHEQPDAVALGDAGQGLVRTACSQLASRENPVNLTRELQRLRPLAQPEVRDRLEAYTQLSPEALREALEQDAQPDAFAALSPEAQKTLADAVAALGKTVAQWEVGASGLEGLERLAARERSRDGLRPLVEAVRAAGDADVAGVLQGHFAEKAVRDLGTDPEQTLRMAARMYRSVCAAQPSADSLARELFHAGEAWPQVADLILRLRDGSTEERLESLASARLALRDAAFGAKAGYERHALISLDAKISRLLCEELGQTVDEVGTLDTDAERATALLALRAALAGAVASGLHVLRDDSDPHARKTERLDEVLESVDGLLEQGKVTEEAYRSLMCRAHAAVEGASQSLGTLIDNRVAVVAEAGVEVDPEFIDQFLKGSPLHYAIALAEKGMRVGLEEEITDRLIQNVKGMRVLNTVGPVVFDTVMVADNTKDLMELQPPRGTLAVIRKLEEKKMVAVGGMVLDTEHAPGGKSHISVYAGNNGITVVALPDLDSPAYNAFFTRAADEGGVYLDDANGGLRMTTVAHALEMGLVEAEGLDRLKPGTNRKIEFLAPTADESGHVVTAEHEVFISEARPTREVKLYVPKEEVKGQGKKCMSFAELGKLGIFGRHLAGEKGLVLALLKSDPTLSKYIPDGSVVTTGRVFQLLRDAGLDEWQKPWREDPRVGEVSSENFLQSAFYTDPLYRAEQRQHLQEVTKAKLEALLVTQGPDGEAALTAAGQALYDELCANPALAQSDNWIARSSFTGEDRPGKSGAGQYESFPHLKDPVSRVRGVIGVIESAWMPEPVDNNVAEQFDLRHIMPSVVMQHCLKPEISGVTISRDTATGARNKVAYQMVRGFGGGVEGGKAEEGVISAAGTSVRIRYDEQTPLLAPPESMKELRKVVLETERFFNETIEPGAGHAVDMEVARVDGQWQVVQARVILMDR